MDIANSTVVITIVLGCLILVADSILRYIRSEKKLQRKERLSTIDPKAIAQVLEAFEEQKRFQKDLDRTVSEIDSFKDDLVTLRLQLETAIEAYTAILSRLNALEDGFQCKASHDN